MQNADDDEKEALDVNIFALFTDEATDNDGLPNFSGPDQSDEETATSTASGSSADADNADMAAFKMPELFPRPLTLHDMLQQKDDTKKTEQNNTTSNDTGPAFDLNTYDALLRIPNANNIGDLANPDVIMNLLFQKDSPLDLPIDFSDVCQDDDGDKNTALFDLKDTFEEKSQEIAVNHEPQVSATKSKMPSTRAKSTTNDTTFCSQGLPFPMVLYDFLMMQNYKTIVDWDDSGTGFIVADVDGFVNIVMKEYFGDIQFDSFRKQLKRYSFTMGRGKNQRVKGSKIFWASNKEFAKGNRRQCAKIRAEKKKRSSRSIRGNMTPGSSQPSAAAASYGPKLMTPPQA